MPLQKHEREFQRALAGRGITAEIIRQQRHTVWRLTDGKVVAICTTSSSPSDRRAARNAIRTAIRSLEAAKCSRS